MMSTETRAIPLADMPTSEAETHIEVNPVPDLPPRPTRKTQAKVLLSAFGAIVLTFGYNQTYGVIQEYYLSPDQDIIVPAPALQSSPPTAMIAFIGTLCYGLTWAGGIVVNPLISRIEHGTWNGANGVNGRTLPLLSPRTITILGILLTSTGFTLASLCSSVWQLLLTQGLLVGFGMSLLYFPFLAPAPEYFSRHRATAMGFVGV
jgi:MFS family permease